MGGAGAEEVFKAIEDLKLAVQDLDYAESDFVDVAVLRLSAAEAKLNTLLREVRKTN